MLGLRYFTGHGVPPQSRGQRPQYHSSLGHSKSGPPYTPVTQNTCFAQYRIRLAQCAATEGSAIEFDDEYLFDQAEVNPSPASPKGEELFPVNQGPKEIAGIAR